jgi:hypothetical protein
MDKNKCNDICEFHREHGLLIKQHDNDINVMGDKISDIKGDISTIDTRTKVLMWFITLTFLVICSVSVYGVVQLNNFKDVYNKDIVKYTRIVDKLKGDIDIINKYKLNR